MHLTRRRGRWNFWAKASSSVRGQRSPAELSLHVALSNSIPEHLERFIQDATALLQRREDGTLSGVTLVTPPGSPLDHDELAELKEAKCELPLQLLDPALDRLRERTPYPPSSRPAP